MIAKAQLWQATRQQIMDVEGETGVLDHDAIHASDDDAVAIAEWVAAGCPQGDGVYEITIRLQGTEAQVRELVDGIEDMAYDGCDIDPDTIDIGWVLS
jgi:hypothetical protein